MNTLTLFITIFVYKFKHFDDKKQQTKTNL